MKPPKPNTGHSHAQIGEENSRNGISRLIISPRKKGYSVSQIKSRIKFILRLNLDDLKEIFEDKNSTILERIIANALKKDIDKAEMASLDKLLNRAFSVSKVNVETKDDFFDKIEITYMTKKIDEIENHE